ncbi:MAG: carbohydrate ABC transporter permease [Micromonosporaceae bacterium]
MSAVNKLLRPGVLVVLGALWLLPTYLLLANAFRPATGYSPDEIWRPSPEFGFIENVRLAWDAAQLGPSIASTFLYAAVSPAAGVVVGALAGYAIVVLRLRGGIWWFMFIFGATIFPTQMLLIPLFLGYSAQSLYDTRIGLILIYTAVCVPLAAFVLRNFFTGIAYSLFEAARMDGASIWRTFWRIYLPMSLPALGAVFILEFTFIWNDLLFGLTLSQTDTVRPVMTAVSSLHSAYSGSTVPVVLAAGLFISLPTVLLFLLTQRLFARGLALGQF